MSRADGIETGAFLSVVSLYIGLGAAFLIDGMEFSAVIGTLPSWALLIATRFAKEDETWPLFI